MSRPIYVVTAYRYGKRKARRSICRSYVVGAVTDKAVAEILAEDHAESLNQPCLVKVLECGGPISEHGQAHRQIILEIKQR